MSENPFNARPPFTSINLLEELESEKEPLKFLVESLIPERSITMLVAPPGTGKSTLSIQLACELSSGLLAFRGLKTERILNIYYVMAERFAFEAFDKMRYMKQRIPINHDHLWIDDCMKGADTLKPTHVEYMIKRIEQNCPHPDIIFLDPIYSLVPGGLSKDEPSAQFCRFCNVLQSKFSCSLWLNHHTSRETYNKDGDKIEKAKAYYGSTWLDALVSGMYELDPRKDQSGCVLVRKKDNFGVLAKEIPLTFDHDTCISILADEYVTENKKLRILAYLNKCYEQKKETSTHDIMTHTGAGVRYIKNIILDPLFKPKIERKDCIGKQTFYKIVSPL